MGIQGKVHIARVWNQLVCTPSWGAAVTTGLCLPSPAAELVHVTRDVWGHAQSGQEAVVCGGLLQEAESLL